MAQQPTTACPPSPQAPVLLLDPGAAVQAYERIRDALQPAEIHYAVKCQPHTSLLAALAGAGAGFEVASPDEISRLTALGVDAAELVYSHPVKAPEEIAAAYDAGVRLYVCDSEAELVKLGEHAPGTGIMVRLRTLAGFSPVHSEGWFGEKFGASPVRAASLLQAAAKYGLEPQGISFHVGSQCEDPSAWIAAIEKVSLVMRMAEAEGIRLRVVDVGGGFPAMYNAADPPPPIEVYGAVIRDALDAYLPYEPARLIAEPGRAIAAPAGTMVATVRGVSIWDPDEEVDYYNHADLLHVNVGIAHGFFEALESGASIPWPMIDYRDDPTCRRWDVVGPSCDGVDIVARDVELSADLGPGDQVYIGCAGAYTTAYDDRFNGLPGPEIAISPGEDAEPGAAVRHRAQQADTTGTAA